MEQIEKPKTIQLESNYPNPFNGGTYFAMQLEKRCSVDVSIFDVLGKRVRTLLKAYLPAGRYPLYWDGLSERGVDLPSGLYFIIIRSHGFKLVRRIEKIK